MNTLQFTLVLLGMGAFMAILAFGVIYGIASMLGIAEDIVDIRLTLAFFVISCVVIYGVSFGVFAGVQKDSCGEVKNWKQIAMNAAIPLAFQAVLTTLVIFVPWFRNVVGDLLPPDTPEFGKSAAAFAYYSFWATMMGGALGGTFSGSCKEETNPLSSLDFPSLPKYEGVNQIIEQFDTKKNVRFNLPPE